MITGSPISTYPDLMYERTPRKKIAFRKLSNGRQPQTWKHVFPGSRLVTQRIDRQTAIVFEQRGISVSLPSLYGYVIQNWQMYQAWSKGCNVLNVVIAVNSRILHGGSSFMRDIYDSTMHHFDSDEVTLMIPCTE